MFLILFGSMFLFCMIAAVATILSVITVVSFLFGSRPRGTKKFARQLGITHAILAVLGTIALLTTTNSEPARPIMLALFALAAVDFVVAKKALT